MYFFSFLFFLIYFIFYVFFLVFYFLFLMSHSDICQFLTGIVVKFRQFMDEDTIFIFSHISEVSYMIQSKT